MQKCKQIRRYGLKTIYKRETRKYEKKKTRFWDLSNLSVC